MRLDAAFRLSTFLSLGIGAFLLGYAEAPFFPWIPLLVLLLEILLVVAYRVEGKWFLSEEQSNVLGLIIGAGIITWIVYQMVSPAQGWLESAPFPASLLPYGGPILIVLLVAKLFRPKSITDYWQLHLIGLIQVVLACVLALEPLALFFLFAYLVCCLWSLALFFPFREQIQSEGVGVSQPVARVPTRLPPLPGRLGGFHRAIQRALVCALVGGAIFLLTPRVSTSQWRFTTAGPWGRGLLQTGFSQQIDLNNSGRLQMSHQPAFDVYVEDAQGRPKTDLDHQHRWRGLTLSYYHEGKWQYLPAGDIAWGSSPYLLQTGSMADLPRLAPDPYYITFHVDLTESSGLFLSDPVALPEVREIPPAVCLEKYRMHPVFYLRDRVLLLPNSRLPLPRKFRYQQVTRHVSSSEISPAQGISAEYLHRLIQQPVPGIRPIAQEHINLLVAQGKLRREELETEPNPNRPEDVYLRPERRYRVARALGESLAYSNEFKYSLEGRRQDRTLDPTEDFLKNVKAGRCTHYATALTLMLRSVGVPARLVNGFRGCEKKPEDGWYTIQESHAHTWVEAMVEGTHRDGKEVLYWLTLDPTPLTEEVLGTTTASFSQWWDRAEQVGQSLWRSLVLDSKTEVNAETSTPWDHLASLQQLNELFRRPDGSRMAWSAFAAPLILIAVLSLAGWTLLRWRSRTKRKGATQSERDSAVGFFSRFLHTIERDYRLSPAPAQTPQEFGVLVQETLDERGPGACQGDWVSRLVHVFYLVRFGGRTLSPELEESMNREIDRLERPSNRQ